MKTWIAVLANFFLPGLGYLILGHKPVLAIGWLLGVCGLTYVELSIQKPLPTLYWIMFASVFVMNTMFAIDAYHTAQQQTE